MLDDARAQKLAEAKRKLKEFQSRSNAARGEGGGGDNGHVSGDTPPPLPAIQQETQNEKTLTGSELLPPVVVNFSSNLSEAVSVASTTPLASALSTPSLATITPTATPPSFETTSDENNSETLVHQQAFQLLIAEKTQLNTELDKYRMQNKECNTELENVQSQLQDTYERLRELELRLQSHQQSTEQLRNINAELQHKLAQSNAQNEDQIAYLDEVKKQLSLSQTQASGLEDQLKEKSKELEMAQIRIQQLSNETATGNESTDNRVETLTQTQFMYEQQIRDLQAMVQQLTQDKEQSNSQYQSYVQHLNGEVTNLNEKNAELLDECAKLQEREKQLVDHISNLEREIQKNIARQDQLKLDNQTTKQNVETENVSEMEKLREKVSEFDLERHEFQLKIKSQEDRLELLHNEIRQKQTTIEELQMHLEEINASQPDKTRLLATMESDKVAASRALSQNIELKKQLDELETRFVQLTNDKADLVNRLDAEEYANREMRQKYTSMEEHLHSIDERFKFKDEEMIRLSHENMELKSKNELLEKSLQNLNNFKRIDENGQLLTDENNHYHDPDSHAHDHHHSHGHGHDHNHDHNNDHSHAHDHDHDHNHDQDPEHHHHHNHQNGHSDYHHRDELTDECQEVKEESDQSNGIYNSETPAMQYINKNSPTYKTSRTTPHIPTYEAVEKLEARFTRLMSQIADLTDEKQRLEHIVLQLQGETETIGEYVALYQTQRRMLKQREYEKAAQMKLLQAEREQLHDKIQMLNNLVDSLGMELPPSTHLNNVAKDPEQQILPNLVSNEKLNSPESKAILNKIQTIITEIKEDTIKEMQTISTTQTADHLNCCLGKFETV